jgi:hypothetical protein
MRVGLLLSLAAVMLLAIACGQPSLSTPEPPTPEESMTSTDQPTQSGSVGVAETKVPTPSPGLQLRLSEGAETPGPRPAVTRPATQPLAESQVQAILDRLPALQPAEGTVQEFALRPSSLPVPRPGTTISQPFPPPATPSPPAVAAGPLEVLRYAPEGDVPLAPYLSVTFNQPMVPLTSLQDLAARDVPVKLSPQPAGKWRWVGTKTLFFEPRNRFPMATKYTVEVPAGIVSATGSKLARAVSWTFTTPPPQLESFHPAGGPHPLHPLLFAAFNQRISPEDVLAKTTVSAGGKQVQVRLATAEEIKADKTVSRLADQAGEGRWLAFRSLEPFPPDTEVTVTFEAGTPSAEGPLTTESAQSFSFSTYGPLVVREHQCGWGDQCPPFAPWFIRFSNPLDETVFQADQVQIKPEVPGVNINVYGDTLQIQGRTSGRTRYQVTLSASLTDQFGQKLGKAQTLTFNVGSASPTIWAPGGNFITLDPYARPTYSVFTVNYGRLKVRAFAVQPEDWAAFKTYLQNYYRTTPPPTPPGREVLSQVVPIQGKADELTETQIDLAPALSNGLGHLVLIVEPERMGLAALLPSRERPPVIQVWVQATHIGLDAFVDHGQMVAWANSLADGAPLADVRLKLWPTGETATTDRAGVATLPLPEAGSAALLVATRGTDTAFLPATTWIWGDGWERRHLADSLRWHVFDDRALYRPGDEVHVKGWIRRLTGGPTGDVEPLDGTEAQVLYVLRDSQGNEIQRGSTDVNALASRSRSSAGPSSR